MSSAVQAAEAAPVGPPMLGTHKSRLKQGTN